MRVIENGADSVDAGTETIRVLVIDPDPDYAELTRVALQRGPCDVGLAHSLDEAIQCLRSLHDLVVIEHRLDGALDIARALQRTQPGLAVLITSDRHLTVPEVLACFHAGADEYVEKPFHPQEFLARAGAVARRVRQSRLVTQVTEDRSYCGVVCDRTRGVATIHQRPLDLTTTEFLLLCELYDAAGLVVSYRELNQQVLGVDHQTPGGTLKSHISALRQKFRMAGADPDLVRTLRGVGYSLAATAPHAPVARSAGLSPAS